MWRSAWERSGLAPQGHRTQRRPAIPSHTNSPGCRCRSGPHTCEGGRSIAGRGCGVGSIAAASRVPTQQSPCSAPKRSRAEWGTCKEARSQGRRDLCPIDFCPGAAEVPRCLAEVPRCRRVDAWPEEGGAPGGTQTSTETRTQTKPSPTHFCLMDSTVSMAMSEVVCMEARGTHTWASYTMI